MFFTKSYKPKDDKTEEIATFQSRREARLLATVKNKYDERGMCGSLSKPKPGETEKLMAMSDKELEKEYKEYLQPRTEAWENDYDEFEIEISFFFFAF